MYAASNFSAGLEQNARMAPSPPRIPTDGSPPPPPRIGGGGGEEEGGGGGERAEGAAQTQLSCSET